jgi:hypothetical protein
LLAVLKVPPDAPVNHSAPTAKPDFLWRGAVFMAGLAPFVVLYFLGKRGVLQGTEGIKVFYGVFALASILGGWAVSKLGRRPVVWVLINVAFAGLPFLLLPFANQPGRRGAADPHALPAGTAPAQSHTAPAKHETPALASDRLAGSPVSCHTCARAIEPFGLPRGTFVGTVGDLGSLPKIEPHHGFVCERCGKISCPVCSGRRATQENVRAFICTACGHRPLKTIYRG